MIILFELGVSQQGHCTTMSLRQRRSAPRGDEITPTETSQVTRADSPSFSVSVPPKITSSFQSDLRLTEVLDCKWLATSIE